MCGCRHAETAVAHLSDYYKPKHCITSHSQARLHTPPPPKNRKKAAAAVYSTKIEVISKITPTHSQGSKSPIHPCSSTTELAKDTNRLQEKESHSFTMPHSTPTLHLNCRMITKGLQQQATGRKTNSFRMLRSTTLHSSFNSYRSPERQSLSRRWRLKGKIQLKQQPDSLTTPHLTLRPPQLQDQSKGKGSMAPLTPPMAPNPKSK